MKSRRVKKYKNTLKIEENKDKNGGGNVPLYVLTIPTYLPS
jgi:hypothetical protein